MGAVRKHSFSLFILLTPGVTNLFEIESYFLVQIQAKGYQLDAHTSERKIAQFAFKYVVIKLNIFVSLKTLIMFTLFSE